MLRLKTYSAEETRAVGGNMARLAAPGDVICLVGGIGAGKTCLTQGIALGLGTSGRVTSPTFTIVHEYRGGRLILYHLDFFRIDIAEARYLGCEDYFYGQGLTVVEWADRVEEILPAQRVLVEFSRPGDPGGSDGEDERLLGIRGIGPRYARFVEELSAACACSG